MNWNKIVSDYLTFSRRDRIAVISLIVIISAVFLIPVSIRSRSNFVSSKDSAQLSETNSSKEIKPEYPAPKHKHYLKRFPNSNHHNNRSDRELFEFDPNTATAEQLKKLGFRDKTIQIIRNYL